MSWVKIRMAREADAKTIESMIFEWSKWQRERIHTILGVLEDRNHLLLVAESDEQLVGVLHMFFYLDIMHGALNCHINFLLVREDFRGKGIGKNLLNEAVKQAKRRNVMEMHVDTVFEDAVKFYQKYGFKDDGVWLELALDK
jgi:GNAT superfamily N-acetyltransferase